MGARNVKFVYARWHDLPHAAFRLLSYMALVSRDDDSPPTFWEGREALALALGHLLDESSASGERAAAFEAVKRGIRELVKRGAIETLAQSSPGRNACYALSVTGTGNGERTPSSRAAEALSGATGNGERTPTGNGERAQRGTVSVRTGNGERTPEEEKEKGGRLVGPYGPLADASDRANDHNKTQPLGPYGRPPGPYDKVMAAFDGDLTLTEEITAQGMLSNGTHAYIVINTISAERDNAELQAALGHLDANTFTRLRLEACDQLGVGPFDTLSTSHERAVRQVMRHNYSYGKEPAA